MIEYHWNKEAKVATNVFELGLKIFSEEPGYVVRYLDFLINTNDDTSRSAFSCCMTLADNPVQTQELYLSEQLARYQQI